MSLFRNIGKGASQGGVLSFENFDAVENGQTVLVADGTPLELSAIDGEVDIVTAAQETEEFSNNVDQVQTATAVTDVAESAVRVQEGIQEADENHVMLSEATREMAAAAVGDTDSAEELVQSSESWVGGRVSTEGFADWIKTVWQNIKDFVARAIQKAKIMWKSWFNGCASLVSAAKKLKESLKNKKDSHKEDKLAIGSYGKTLVKANGTFDHAQVGVAVDHIKGHDFAGVAKDVIAELEKVVIKASEDVTNETQLSVFEKAVFDELAGAANKAAGNTALSGSKYPRDAKGGVTKLAFGNKQTAAYYVARDGATIPEVINSFTIRFETAEDNFKFNFGKDDAAKLPALKKGVIEGLCGDVETIGKNLGDYFEKDTKAIDKKIGELRDKLSKAMENKKDSTGNVAQTVLSSLGRLYTISTQLLRSQMSEAAFYVSCGQAVLAYAKQHANNLENDDKK